jgi:multidrug efflux pump subunit AcrA (membrane-fusion protein)
MKTKISQTLKKRVLPIILVLAVAGGCGYGGFRVYRSNFGGAVAVYEITDSIAMTEYWGDNPEYEGVVGTEGLQTVTLSDTQTVEEVKVKQGDKVKKGDPLFTYDSTLTNLDLQRKELEIQQKQLDLNAAQKELKTIASYKPGVAIPGSKTGSGYIEETSSESSTAVLSLLSAVDSLPVIDGLELLGGDGTEESPFLYDWKAEFSYTPEFITAVMQGEREAFVTFQVSGEQLQLMDTIPADPGADTDPSDTSSDSSGSDTSSGSDNSGDSQKPSTPDTPSQPDTQPDSSQEPDQSSEPDTSNEPDTSSDSSEEGDQSTGDKSDSSQGDSSDNGDGSQAHELSAQAQVLFPTRLGSVTKDNEDGSGDVWDDGKNHDDDGDDTDGDSSGDSSSDSSEEEGTHYAVSWTIQFQQTNGVIQYQLLSVTIGGVTQKIADPLPPLGDEEPEVPEEPIDSGDWGDWIGSGDDWEDPGIVYTRDELNEMLKEQQKVVRDLDLEIRQSKLEYRKLQNEMENTVVYSTLDGVVSYVGDPDDRSESFIKVYAGGGYIIQASINELVLDSVKIGQSVTINDWMSGDTYEGVVKSIGDYPSGSGYEGNTNSSYYPVIISVDQSHTLEEYNWVGVTLQSSGEASNGLYLQNAFVITEGGKSYVYVQNDEGKLEKRQVSVGRSLWGYYQEIRSGLSMGDYIAFPYGKNLKDGADTRVADLNELFGDSYY